MKSIALLGAAIRIFLISLIWMSIHGVAWSRATDSDRSHPNLVFIMADDLGYGHLGCYGQKHIRTPRLDRMAREGTRFTQCYAGNSVCAPSRSVLMTGTHSGHTSVRINGGGAAILPRDVTIAEVLKEAGYTTGIFGKWGLGDEGDRTSSLPWARKGWRKNAGYARGRKA